MTMHRLPWTAPTIVEIAMGDVVPTLPKTNRRQSYTLTLPVAGDLEAPRRAPPTSPAKARGWSTKRPTIRAYTKPKRLRFKDGSVKYQEVQPAAGDCEQWHYEGGADPRSLRDMIGFWLGPNGEAEGTVARRNLSGGHSYDGRVDVRQCREEKDPSDAKPAKVKKKPGRKPLGTRAMTGAERAART